MMNPRSLQEEYHQSRPANTIKRGRLLEKIIGRHSEKAVNYKIVKTSCGIKITASEAVTYSLIYFSLPPCFLFSSPLNFKSRSRITLHPSSFSPLHPFFPKIPVNEFLKKHLRELKSLCGPPSHSHFFFF